MDGPEEGRRGGGAGKLGVTGKSYQKIRFKWPRSGEGKWGIGDRSKVFVARGGKEHF